ncbi:MAG: sulfatase-like hydrolase/transferase, partial [Verrucomicrobiae bacterium]|nr:sulfatase-like hydrolase/transferase [Verrucomicrobiae bacterium]
PAVAAEKRPNIVVMMADDIGYENLSCYGSKVYDTPNIDRLAATGIRFDHAHAQPICTPSRVQIMTGIYNSRNYIRFGILDPEATTFGNLLRDGGYRTAIAGKWQLEGGLKGPDHFGFDRYCLWQLTRRPSRYPNPGLEIDGEEKDFKHGEFGPDLINDYVCQFIEEQKEAEAPFLVYYPMLLTHWPFVPTPDHPDWDPEMWRDAVNEPGGYRSQKYWDAFVRYCDKMVGKVVDTLEKTGQRDNTLVIWTGDNGTYTDIVSEFRGQPYRGGKGSPKDNGTHVGFVASWPGVIEPGRTSDALVDLSDILPTLTDVAGTQTPAGVDGASLLPVFQGKDAERKKNAIYCWYHRDGVRDQASQHARDQRYKLYATGELYDTVEDMEEKKDLAAGGVPDSLKEEYAKLKAVLDPQVAAAAAADETIEAKQAKFGGKGKKAKGGKKKKKTAE